jgi:hypothetical protein
MSLIRNEDKIERSAARFAQREYQRRVIEQLKTRLGKEVCGAFIGRKICLDTETADIDRGQRVRFGVAQLHGMDYQDITSALNAGVALTRKDLNELKAVYVFYNPRDMEKSEDIYERSLTLLQTMCAEREHTSGVPHILIEKDDFVSSVLLCAVLHRQSRRTFSAADTVSDNNHRPQLGFRSRGVANASSYAVQKERPLRRVLIDHGYERQAICRSSGDYARRERRCD